jgi:hypothetical protein
MAALDRREKRCLTDRRPMVTTFAGAISRMVLLPLSAVVWRELGFQICTELAPRRGQNWALLAIERPAWLTHELSGGLGVVSSLKQKFMRGHKPGLARGSAEPQP